MLYTAATAGTVGSGHEYVSWLMGLEFPGLSRGLRVELEADQFVFELVVVDGCRSLNFLLWRRVRRLWASKGLWKREGATCIEWHYAAAVDASVLR